MQSDPPNARSSRGLSRDDFSKVSANGFGDGDNAYAHSMAYFKDHVLVGTSRATMALLGAGDQGGMKDVSLDAWPVELADHVYTPAFENHRARAEIWRLSPLTGVWTRVYQAPMVYGTDGTHMSRDLGYRAMAVFQGERDPEPALYVSTWSRSRGRGMQLLRSYDGEHFAPVGPPGLAGLDATSTRSLVPFKGRLFTTPTGATAGRQNVSGIATVFASRDPAGGDWTPCNDEGFGDRNNLGVFEMLATQTHLYAGTVNFAKGYQLWRTDAEGEPPYRWERLLVDGAGRGQLNQGVVSLAAFRDAVFVGSGIQKGGIDKQNRIGPAGPELIRVNADASFDIIMGERRTQAGPLSGLMPGWNNIFCGSIWKMNVHDGWLYAGTQDWLVFLLYRDFDKLDSHAGRLLRGVDIEHFVETAGGYDLWRSRDGENWLPVTRCGFENPYNHGVRNILSTPHGMFVGSSNQFGPRSAFRIGPGAWEYRNNPRGGTEIWQGVRR
ncbi:hypothetical protein [uncultured Thiohalocapsa sp.]|uniref:hypothetical protein n=1 Tax=uncultured Thiohalocapsa sp. TaxID=768990 RepID=UPI0025D92742|nr:hypothetical protein [uncultured Thiohalocapsa sp.]